MKYVALLRGINVGGNTLIKMAELKKVFEDNGYTNVVTYINSGNVLFETDERDMHKVRELLEQAISSTFHYNIRLVIRSHEQLQGVASDVPSEWKKENDLRCYIAFVIEPVTAGDIVKEVEVNEGIDFVKEGKYVLYLSTRLSGLTKSRFNKLAGKKIYQDITIRNYTTTRKLLALMEKH